MAVNKRYMVVGKWYGQHFAGAEFEVWDSMEQAKCSLLVRDNMMWDTQRQLGELEYGSDFLHITKVDHVRWYAAGPEARYIDVYGHEMEYDPAIMGWKFLIGDMPVYRLELGPRGGVRRENY